MKDRETPSFDSPDQEDLTPVHRLRDHVATETIDIKGLFGEDLTTSGSFNFGDVLKTPLGKLLQALPIVALLVDGELNVVFMNRAGGKIVPGWENAQGIPYRKLFPDRSAAEAATGLIGDVLATRKPIAREAVLGSDKNKIWGRISYRALRVSGERLVLVLVEDLTHEKRQIHLIQEHKKELQQAYDGLERRVQERTEELRKANDQLRTEIDNRQRAENALRRQLEIEKLLKTLSTSFINVSPEHLDEAIHQALRMIGESAQADRSYVFLYSDSGQTMMNTHEWCAQGVTSQVQRMQSLPSDGFPWFTDRIKRLDAIWVPNVASLPEEAHPEKEHWQSQDIQSLIIAPIRYGGDLKGFVGFDFVKAARQGPEGMASILRIVGDIFGNALERKRSGQDLRRLETAIEQAAEAIVITDTEGTIEYVNPAFERTSGYPAKEVIGNKPSILKSGIHDQAFYGNLWETISQGVPWSGRFTNRRRDGSIYEEEATISPVKDDSGRIRNYVAVNRDVTKEALLQRQLRQAQKMEAIGTLAGGIAHDFNNILTIISGFAELAYHAQSAGSQAQSDLQQVLRASGRAGELVKQILTVSRKGDQEKIPVSVTPVVKETVKFLRASLPSTIDISHRIDPALGKILADPTQVQQVLMNLGTNAGHAMKEKGGQLDIRLDTVQLVEADLPLEPEMSAGPYLRLTVSDTGHGIPAEILDRIFEPYFTTKKTGEGTGLGLAVVHGIVKSHGGTIRVHSQVGQGSSFEAFFPFTEGADQPDAPVESDLPTGRESILFVDDEEAVAHLGKRLLEGLGYRVTTKTDSLEALEVFRSDPDQFDLVITDMTMPKATGRDLAMQIMRIRPNIPVVLCTGYSDQINEGQARALGIKEMMMKPLSRTRVAHLVRDVLDGSARARSNDRA